MPTRLYRFHCTDGHDLVADLRGRRLPTLALVRLQAERVALELMMHGGRLDWSDWWVEVYDQSGRVVLAKPFTEVRTDRPAARDSEDAA
ncbi:hypothetical protein [Methylobacterium sp. Leaf117]|uniref:DUF6894 family protein n=1 Tax=Methylobacterium sp. Leaf117 TaxID=1736260 RepID=UPI0006FF1056|nr:hypothetical protein [Methylobacterium sp. Leaf117]KQP82969.1 hypothetical protein ASF57_12685 [Methylobacterium sp. Leaf117]